MRIHGIHDERCLAGTLTKRQFWHTASLGSTCHAMRILLLNDDARTSILLDTVGVRRGRFPPCLYEHTLVKSPTHSTSARIVRVRIVVSQDICDEGTMEAICDDDDDDDDDDVIDG